jgi:hypothetical protein
MNWLKKLFGFGNDAGLHEPPGEYIRPIDIKRVALLHPKQVLPDDRLSLQYVDKDARITEKWLDDEPIKESIRVTHAVMFSFKDALGFKHAIGVAFGEGDKQAAQATETKDDDGR